MGGTTYSASVFFYNRFGIKQPNTKAFYIMSIALRHPIKLFKNVCSLSLSQALAIVFDAYLTIGFALIKRNFDKVATIFYSIVKKVV